MSEKHLNYDPNDPRKLVHFLLDSSARERIFVNRYTGTPYSIAMIGSRFYHGILPTKLNETSDPKKSAKLVWIGGVIYRYGLERDSSNKKRILGEGLINDHLNDPLYAPDMITSKTPERMILDEERLSWFRKLHLSGEMSKITRRDIEPLKRTA